MKTYAQFRPTGFDTKGLGCDDEQAWLVAPIGLNRDSDALTRSNWRVVLKDLGGEGEDVQVHRFGHWACGWFEVCLVRPGSTAAKSAEEWEAALANYPVASDEDFSEEEQTEANETWANCYRDAERIEYIREHRSQFEFHSFSDLLGCARGRYFAGYASELLS